MNGILHQYMISSETWFYHALLLIIAVYFRFNRFWSVRNLDLMLLLGISAAAVLPVSEDRIVPLTYAYTVSGLLLVRLLIDGGFHRRPRLDQNLNLSGLAFLAAGAFAFIMANVFTRDLPESAVVTVRHGNDLVNRVDSSADHTNKVVDSGPASSLIAAAAGGLTRTIAPDQETADLETMTAQIMTVLAHSAVIAGLLLVGARHFGDRQLGVAMAALYLLLPCTANDVHRVNHVLPAALIIWAFVAYRRPAVSGALLGMACGTLFFTVFLAPLWMAFYGRRSAVRFGVALVLVAGVLMGTLIFTSADTDSLTRQLIGTINWKALEFIGEADRLEAEGLPGHVRIPLFAGFCVLLVSLTIWPRRKTLEHLVAHSTTIVLATQLWYPQRPAVYFLWYLPLMLLVVFRPRLDRMLPPDVAAAGTTTRPPRTISERSTAGSVRTTLFL